MMFPYLSKVIILTTVIHPILALDVCRDTDNTDCQSCGTTKYPIDDGNRHNCMKSCGVCTVTNVAYNKPTSQSSTHIGSKGGALSLPSHAVDGNVDQEYGGATSSCSHTLTGSPSWWCVDLQQMYNIGSIKLFNREGFEERLSGFELKISSGGQCDESGFNSSTPCYKDTPPTTQSIYTIESCDGQQPISAKTVFIGVNNQVLSLCEVQIFSARCNDGYYSASSSKCRPCNTCLNDKCNHVTGVCTDGCKDTYYGDKCESPCSDKCTDRKCFTTSPSSQLQCTSGCVDGYKGSYCQTSCPEKVVECTGISPIAIGIIGVLCGIVSTVAVVVSYHFYKKRRQSSQPKTGNDADYVYSNTDLNPTSSTTDDTLTTGYQNIPTNTRNVDYVNQSFNTENNTRNMYDTLDHTPDSTQHTYTTIDSNKVN